MFTAGTLTQLKRIIANVLQRLVIDRVGHVRVLDQLIHGQGGIVRFDHRARHLRRRYYRVGGHNSIGVLFFQFADQQRAQTAARTTADRMAQLETLQTVASFGFLSYDVQDLVHNLSSLGVVTFSPVVAFEAIQKKERCELARVYLVTGGNKRDRLF